MQVGKCDQWCIVPLCKNTRRNNANKIFIRVPFDAKKRKLWLLATRRDPLKFNPKTVLYVCEDHFNLEEDMENYIEFKLTGCRKRMKRNVVPHVFDPLLDKKLTQAKSEPNIMISLKRTKFRSIILPSSTGITEQLPKDDIVPLHQFNNIGTHTSNSTVNNSTFSVFEESSFVSLGDDLNNDLRYQQMGVKKRKRDVPPLKFYDTEQTTSDCLVQKEHQIRQTLDEPNISIMNEFEDIEIEIKEEPLIDLVVDDPIKTEPSDLDIGIINSSNVSLVPMKIESSEYEAQSDNVLQPLTTVFLPNMYPDEFVDENIENEDPLIK